MSVHVKAGDAWKTCKSVHVNVSGKWYTCKQVYVNAGGTWKPCMLVSGSKTVNGPSKKGGSVTLSNVKSGTTVKVYGEFENKYEFAYELQYNFTGCTDSVKKEIIYPYTEWKSFSFTTTSKSTTVKVTADSKHAIFEVGYVRNVKIQYTQEYYP